MKRLLIGLVALLVLIIVLVVVAPTWKDAEVISEDSEKNKALEELPVITEDAQETITEEAPVAEEKVAIKIESIEFGYSTNSFTQANVIYYAKGDLMKLVFPKPLDVGIKRYDTVYLDRNTKTAIGYCEAKGYCKDRNKEVPISFDTYEILTPVEWDLKLPRAKLVQESIANGKKAMVYNDNGITYWIDVYTSLPVKVVDVDGEHYYNLLSFNRVKDEELVHQQLQNY